MPFPSLGRWACIFASLLLSLPWGSSGLHLRVHNPTGVDVHTVHAIFSNHFDAGCKIPECTRPENLAPGEPNLCAQTMHGLGEPYNFHVMNRYLDEFLPAAVANAEQARREGLAYKYLAQPWVVSLFLDCEGNGIKSWPELGAIDPGRPLIHCPNQTAVASVREALARGDIFLHGFPHDGEASYYPDESLFDSALSMAKRIAREAGIDPPRSVSQRDVPGWTRAALPLLARSGIHGLSIGAGTPPGKPDVPPVFVWRDEPSGDEVVTTYETGYGDDTTVFVLPSGVAMAACWESDNRGPPDLDFVRSSISTIQKRFPSASVVSSTFDAFFDVANEPSVKSQLPVVTGEIGDGWLYGVPSDPIKNSMFLEASRTRAACLDSGACNASSPAFRAFDRMLIKVPEHTWGVAQSWFLPDYDNYTNAKFDIAREAGRRSGFIRNNTNRADYNTTVNSWFEQRTYVQAAPDTLQRDHPNVASGLAQRLEAIARPPSPAPVDELLSAGYEIVTSEPRQCGRFRVAFNADGSIGDLTDVRSGQIWASANQSLGRALYQSFTNEDYNTYLNDFAARLGDTGQWPKHTPPKNACWKKPGAPDDDSCGNFRKPGMSAADPRRRQIAPSVTSVLLAPRAGDDMCSFELRATFPEEATRNAGAPKTVAMAVNVSDTGVQWDVAWVDKRPTRLAESIMFSFNPPDRALDGWRLGVLGSNMRPDDVVAKRGDSIETSVYGGSPHMKGARNVTWTLPGGAAAPALVASSLDVPIVCVGEPNPFPTPRDVAPNTARDGFHFVVYNNIWNTNYILWFPYDDAKIFRSRFSLEIA